jgi:gamma-glutamylcyclotransferase (GGCT)/AIG2-like uncharacterized protein YtfP
VKEGPNAVFVYGTLMPGEERWPLVEEHVVAVRGATVRGQLFDTGRGYPCALFDRDGEIPGALLQVDPDELDNVLVLLDEVEGVSFGLYTRVVVTTDAHEPAWSYAWARDLDGLVRIVKW